MPHSKTKIYVHAILGVKYKSLLIQLVIKEKIYQLLKQEMENLSCKIIAINGMPDHVHILFLMNSNLSISKIMKQIKGASSFKINQAKYMNFKFAWQVGYGAFSVSKSLISTVEKYIENQEKHHQTMNYEEELMRFEMLYEI